MGSKQNSGIYLITNKENNKMYVGSAVSINGRWLQHKSELRRNIHANKRFQNAWNKYGEESFIFEIVLLCEKKNLLMYEQIVLDFYKAADRNTGYNICVTAGSQLGLKRSEEIKKAQSIARTGSKRSEETKKKMSEAQRGRKRGPLSEEQKKKISEFHTGRKRPSRTEEQKAKYGVANIGRIYTEEEKRARSERQKGKLHTEETKNKMRESRLKYFEENPDKAYEDVRKSRNSK